MPESTYQSAPSEPEAIAPKRVPDAGRVGGLNSFVTTPAVVIRPTSLDPASVNHSAPSDPAAMPDGLLPPPGTRNSVIAPPGVIRPIWSPPFSVNQTLPSGPAAMPVGWLPPPATANSAIDPWMPASLPAPGFSHPIRSPSRSVNHTRPPALVMSRGSRPAGRVNSVTVPPGVTRAIRLAEASATQTFPSAPWVIPDGVDAGLSSENSAIAAADGSA